MTIMSVAAPLLQIDVDTDELAKVLLPLGIVFVGILISVSIFLYQRKKAKERMQAMQMVAGQLGWAFAPKAPLNMISGLDRFALFNQGHGKQIINFMYGQAGGIKAAVFDYIYVIGYGRNRQVHRQSVVYLEPPNLALPYFSLRPENFFLKIATAFGYQDIDFGQRPEFSRRYILRGQDETSIRRTFNDALLAFYETYTGTCTDAGGNQLFVFRGNHRFQPNETQSFVTEALNILNLVPKFS